MTEETESNVVQFGGVTRIDLPPETVLEQAAEVPWGEGLVVMGWDTDGYLRVRSSFASGPEVLWLLEKTKESLLDAEL